MNGVSFAGLLRKEDSKILIYVFTKRSRAFPVMAEEIMKLGVSGVFEKGDPALISTMTKEFFRKSAAHH